MLNQIALITIVTDDVPRLAAFYREVLGFAVKTDMGGYVEFHNDGVRFAICTRSILREASGHASYAEAVAQGATPVHTPADMPWGQRTAMFADPDGNIHEFFADLPR